MSLYARLAALIVIVLAIGAAWWKFDGALAAREKVGYERRAREDKAAADEQAERNRDLQRSAEKRYTVKTEVREQFFNRAAPEVRHAAQELAACPVPEPLRVRLNAAAQCAGEDRPAACGPGEPVREPR